MKPPCDCGLREFMAKQRTVVSPEPVPWRCRLGWHLYRKSSGMYGDLAVDCVLCEATHYTSLKQLWWYRVTGRLYHG